MWGTTFQGHGTYPDLTRCVADEACNDVQERGLAGTIGTYQAQDLVSSQSEVDALKGTHAPELYADTLRPKAPFRFIHVSRPPD